jgi:hypothetical protein
LVGVKEMMTKETYNRVGHAEITLNSFAEIIILIIITI